MNYKMMGKFLSQILIVEAGFMVPALLISLYTGSRAAVYGFGLSILITAGVGALMYYFCRNSTRRFFAREGMVCVAGSWIAISFFGCLPFVFSREIPNFVDALFEIVSGFTTTGSSILGDVEALSPGIMYWRSFSHWLGGMGVLVFLLALSPNGERGKGYTMHLLRAESPGPNVNKLVPKMRTTARILYVIYMVLTFINFLFLLLGKMPVFDAVCTAFGTAGTGGFGIRNDSIAGYSPVLQNIITVFMILSGVNYVAYFYIMTKQLKEIFKVEEIRVYFGIILGAGTFIALNIRSLYGSLGEAFRHAFFQVGSIITTCGYATTDFDLWPETSKMILVLLMFIGACAGSTGGGFKISRLLILCKAIPKQLSLVIHPREVKVIRMDGKPIDHNTLRSTNVYLAIYFFILLVSTLLISVDNFNLTTNFTAVASTLNNIGPGVSSLIAIHKKRRSGDKITIAIPLNMISIPLLM